MAMFDGDLLKRLEYLSLIAPRTDFRSLLSTSRCALPGGGTEVTGVRDYAPGDEYRYIDWIWCARRDELLTRMYGGDTDTCLYILLDCSSSMELGRRAKFDIARRIAALAAYVVTGRLDRVHIVAFANGTLDQSPSVRDRARFPLLLQFLEQLQLRREPTDLVRSAEQFVRRYQPHGPVLLISDLYDPAGFEQGLDVLRCAGYEPRIVQVYDPAEAEPSRLGDVQLCDVESDTTWEATITEQHIARYRELFAQFHASVREYCSRWALRCLQIAADEPEEDTFLRVLGAKDSGVSQPQPVGSGR